MKRTFYSLLPLLAVASIAGTWLVMNRPQVESPQIGGSEPEFGSARHRWEWLRLRDPATGRIPDGIRERELAYARTLPTRDSERQLFKSSGFLDSEWKMRGPFNIGGRTRAVAFDMTGEDTIIAGGVTGGIWRSTDAGMTWTRATTRTQVPSVTSIIQDPRPGKQHIWYHGSGELHGNSATDGGAFYHGNGIFRSTDNGRSWHAMISSGTPQAFDITDNSWRLAIDPSNQTEDEIYAALYGVISRSTNGGGRWSQVLRPASSSSSYYTDVAVTSTGVVYATLSSEGGRKGIWRSTDGITWTDITPAAWPELYNRIVIGIAPSNENVVYFLAETPGVGMLGRNFRGDSSWQSLWKYTYLSGDGKGDGGAWENRSANLPNYGPSNGDFYSQSGYDLHVHVRPDNENAVFIGGTNLYRSTDGFATPNNTKWIGGFKFRTRDSAVVEDYSYPNHHADQHAVIFSPTNPKIMLSASDGGVHKTLDNLADSVTWIDLNRGYYTTQFYTVAIDHATAGSQMIVGGLQDNGTWRTDGVESETPWVEVGTSDGAYCAVADGGSTLYVSKQEGRIYRVLLDAQKKMIDATRVDPAEGKGFGFINPFELDPSNPNMMFVPGGFYLWRNSDLTQIPMGSKVPTMVNWKRLEQTRLADTTAVISALGISTANPSHRVYYGTSKGEVYRLDNADAGEPTPTIVTGGSFPKNSYVTAITVDPLDADKAIVVFSNYNVQSLFYTTDGGETWTPIGGNLEPGHNNGASCRWASILHRPNGTLYLVATSTGLYSTLKLDGANTVWVQEGPTTIGNVVVDMVTVRQSDGFVAVGTHGSGVYSTTIATVGVDEEEVTTGSTAAGMRLEQNTPNPSRGATTIRFTVPPALAAERTRLRVFDVTGREVVTLVDGRMEAGEHVTTFDPSALGKPVPNGVYLYRLEVGREVMSKTMSIVR